MASPACGVSDAKSSSGKLGCCALRPRAVLVGQINGIQATESKGSCREVTSALGKCHSSSPPRDYVRVGKGHPGSRPLINDTVWRSSEDAKRGPSGEFPRAHGQSDAPESCMCGVFRSREEKCRELVGVEVVDLKHVLLSV
jgi:hypothetical protein